MECHQKVPSDLLRKAKLHNFRRRFVASWPLTPVLPTSSASSPFSVFVTVVAFLLTSSSCIHVLCMADELKSLSYLLGSAIIVWSMISHSSQLHLYCPAYSLPLSEMSSLFRPTLRPRLPRRFTPRFPFPSWDVGRSP